MGGWAAPGASSTDTMPVTVTFICAAAASAFERASSMAFLSASAYAPSWFSTEK